jgi:hypothetical protein
MARASAETKARAPGPLGSASGVVCPVIQVQRRSRPGYPEQENRSVTYWYDPGRHLWAKWHVVMHGHRSYAGFTFTYDENLTATLQGFQPP